jgi:hypothetical protein
METQLAGNVARNLGLFLSILLFYGCNAGVQQQPTQPASLAQPAVPPAVSINALMVAWIDHSGHELWDVEQKGRAPQTDADWRRLERHATQLAASGTLIALGGTGEYDREWSQRPGWKTQAQALTDAAVACLSAIRSKNFEAVVRANSALTDTCERCHEEFKPSLPTEGITHQPY